MGEALRVVSESNGATSAANTAGAASTTNVTDELNEILATLRSICPSDAQISFTFDRRLLAHIDVRTREQINLIEAILPVRCHQLLEPITRGRTPNHPFFQRLTALVNR